MSGADLPMDDTAALLTFKDNFITGDVVLADWKESNGGPCSGNWSDVTCKNGRVTEMWVDGKLHLSLLLPPAFPHMQWSLLSWPALA
jgi:hypothetical protein